MQGSGTEAEAYLHSFQGLMLELTGITTKELFIDMPAVPIVLHLRACLGHERVDVVAVPFKEVMPPYFSLDVSFRCQFYVKGTATRNDAMASLLLLLLIPQGFDTSGALVGQTPDTAVVFVKVQVVKAHPLIRFRDDFCRLYCILAGSSATGLISKTTIMLIW